MKQNHSLKDDVRNKIITEILIGTFPVNSIVTEKQLIEMFTVSKTTLREALVELRNENVLESMPRYGYRIVELNRNDIEDAMEVRMLLELAGLEKSIHQLDENKINMLKNYNDECERTRISADLWTHWNNNIKFHLLLNSLAGNTWMQTMLDKTMSIISRAYAQSYWEQWGNSAASLDIDTHREIVSSLENKEFDKAKQKLVEDILSLKI
ncbi:GntR family transcriptional regulator [Bacillus sp. FJAT-50079]|uniref:GntR family transcriptional regulator n=1 Tax=Bacillus sp. FJAT-50079 TaxID=2833577 RepID=UPI001BC91283|nr:GntR family transcriptional regulator [Bacillus sp. FJAT-50079]MBS4206684.1 GntR family transcriptional regulator [Bacillus sp. FJAT-50079]